MPSPSMGGVRFFQFTQSAPATTWTIYHAFGSKPLVELNVDDSGTVKKAYPLSIEHTDDNTVTVTWSTARTGRASLATTLAT
jgi:hypothetical protein